MDDPGIVDRMRQFNVERFIYDACHKSGIPQDTNLLGYINNVYMDAGSSTKKYFAGDFKPEALSLAVKLSMLTEKEAQALLTGKMTSESAEDIMVNLSIDAHNSSYTESGKDLDRQKLLLWLDQDYREEKIAEYEGIMLSFNGGNNP